MLPHAHAQPPAWIADRWLPALGSLLAALGFAVLLAGPMDIVAEVRPPPAAFAQIWLEERPDPTGAQHGAVWLDNVACRNTAAPRGEACPTFAADGPLAAAVTNRSPEAFMRPERVRGTAACWGSVIDRGTRSESAHLADVALCPDPRQTLAAMAATQRHGRGFRSRHTDSGDLAASAMFDPALTQQPVAPRGAKHLSEPIRAPRPSGVRWSLMNEAGAYPGDRATQRP